MRIPDGFKPVTIGEVFLAALNKHGQGLSPVTNYYYYDITEKQPGVTDLIRIDSMTRSGSEETWSLGLANGVRKEVGQDYIIYQISKV